MMIMMMIFQLKLGQEEWWKRERAFAHESERDRMS